GEGGGWQSLSEGRGASEPSEKARRPLSLPPPLGAPLIWERRHPETTTCLSAHLPPDSCLSALLSSIALTCGICATPPRSRGCPLQDRSTRRRPPRRALLRGLGAGSLESTRALEFPVPFVGLSASFSRGAGRLSQCVPEKNAPCRDDRCSLASPVLVL
ncbi:unnamed protein product, partial [Prorocentrum cordatum]